MRALLVNIDVPDLEKGAAFYAAALGLRVGRRFDGFLELLGADAPIFLLEKTAGTPAGPFGGAGRTYARHWCPVHLDFVVANLDVAVRRALAAGAVPEGGTRQEPFGRLATFADPFGHGFCLVEFGAQGYDALTQAPATGREPGGVLP